jgi:hypothetical protein
MNNISDTKNSSAKNHSTSMVAVLEVDRTLALGLHGETSARKANFGWISLIDLQHYRTVRPSTAILVQSNEAPSESHDL